MTKKLLFFLCVPFIALAQDYQLNFNSASLDYVEITGVSSLIANKTAFSISGWVYPQMDVSHSGLFGFRNNTDADFYLLQLQNTNNVEARFRNSIGTSYDIVAANLLDFGQWQHLAFTYDGTHIRLYKNGNIVDSTSANGTIMQAANSLKLGSLDWSGTGFYMIGSLDEIRLWDAAILPNEINSWMCVALDSTHPSYNNLMGYWRLNEGIGAYTDDQSINSNTGTLLGGTNWQLTTSCFGATAPTPKTYVPDDNFEQLLILQGFDNVLDDSVLTANINVVTDLQIANSNIVDLTGIEDFTSLSYLYCPGNQIATIDVSNLQYLDTLICYNNLLTTLVLPNSVKVLDCSNNQLATIDISNNLHLFKLSCAYNPLNNLILNDTSLLSLYCHNSTLSTINLNNNINLEKAILNNNQLSSIDISGALSLKTLLLHINLLDSLDITNNNNLEILSLNNNNLSELDLRNGNNLNMQFAVDLNPNLNCISVDDVAWSTANWTVANGNIDSHHYFSTDCSFTSVEESLSSDKDLIKIIDVLGREIKPTEHNILFYIYKDGTVEKKLFME